MHEELKKTAVSVFDSVLKASAAHGGTFRLLITAKVGETEKPLLLIGNAHSDVEDGHVISILNPDESLLAEVDAGCAYSSDRLKEIVGGKCDAMLELWIDAYKKEGVSELSRYKAREPKAAKFSIR